MFDPHQTEEAFSTSSSGKATLILKILGSPHQACTTRPNSLTNSTNDILMPTLEHPDDAEYVLQA